MGRACTTKGRRGMNVVGNGGKAIRNETTRKIKM
jgi:hypothetical protein